MKNIISVIVFLMILLVAETSFSQPALKWQILDTTGNGGYFYSSLFMMDNNNNIILAGDTGQDNSTSGVINKYSSSGYLTWHRNTDSALHIYSITGCFDKNNNYYFGCIGLNSSFLFCYDSTGKLNWNVSTGLLYNESITTDSKCLVLVGDFINSTISKYSLSGNLIWEQHYIDSNYQYYGLQSSLIDDLGNIYAWGYVDTGVNHLSWLVVKYSPEGKFLWRQIIGSPGINEKLPIASGKMDKQGNIILTGVIVRDSVNQEMGLAKINPSGAINWIRYFPDSSVAEAYGSDVTIDNTGNIYVAGVTVEQTGTIPYRKPFALKYDSSGNIIWTQVFTDSCNFAWSGFWFEFENVLTDKYQCVYIATTTGETYHYTIYKVDATGKNTWTYKFTHDYDALYTNMALDDSLNIYVTGETEIATGFYYLTIKLGQNDVNAIQNVVAYNQYFSVFPNPVGNRLLINTCLPLNSNIVITDILGHTVLTQQVTSQNNIVDIDVSQLTTGVYFVEANNHGYKTVAKIVKE